MNPLDVLALEVIDSTVLKRFTLELPQVRLRFADAEEVSASAEPAEVIFGRPSSAELERFPRLRWVQLPFAGVGGSFCDAARRAGIIVTNSAGLYSVSIAEHAIGLMIALAKRFDQSLQQQRDRCWATPVHPRPDDLSGRSVAIFGAGRIGQAIARLCRGLGMQVLGCRRRPRPTPFCDHVVGPDQLIEIASRVPWLVCAAPLTERTRGVINERILGAMPRGGRFINVSRGAIVDEPALIGCLRSGHLTGAGLDVFADEPLPADSPLWSQPGVLITAHTAGVVVNASSAAGELFLRNVHRDVHGLPLENVVDLNEGY